MATDVLTEHLHVHEMIGCYSSRALTPSGFSFGAVARLERLRRFSFQPLLRRAVATALIES